MIFKLMPGLKHLVQYNYDNLTGDLFAGLIVTFLLLPQSMAYAIIAGVPLAAGLFAATFPLIVYALFGNSKYLSVGPVSVVSLLGFSGISSIVQPHSSQFLELMILLALIVGIVQIFMGLIKFGSIFEYVSLALISGFTSAIAIIISVNQIKSIMGVSLPGYNNFLNYSIEVLKHLPKVNIITVVIGLGSLIILLALKKKFPVSPGPLIVIIASVLIVNYYDLNKIGVDIVGEIPQELPVISINIPAFDTFLILIPIACMIGFISFVESYAIAKTLSNKENEILNPNQELIGLGLANMTSSFVGAIPVAGAISRSAVNHQSGAKSNLSLLIAAFFMLFSIIYLTPLFYYLPKATLAAIIIIAVSNLINLKQIIYYFKSTSVDALIFLATFIATLMIDIFIGLIIGFFFSFLVKGFKKC
ncbi:SulP family inorganic anion transporter [Virgibacillus sp. C22-A2]|uniref:SulP family inorganic anion transporter n=1 Tax=Virgibacillus tibetensis TaxID=3042313 RepID=A0ABU6KDU4_9BACI|nr:SulP family inorganic anion transporter [Virgibacillus sp. C22-A2]